MCIAVERHDQRVGPLAYDTCPMDASERAKLEGIGYAE